MGFSDMKDLFRLSRISQPRATLAAILLIAAVFITFGVFADQALPSTSTSASLCADFECGQVWLHIQSLLDVWKP